MINENDLVRVTSETKVLLEILNLLNTLNSNIEGIRKDLKSSNTNTPVNKETSLKLDYMGMKRPELMKLVSELKNKPEGWTKYTNKDLIKILEKR